MDYSPPLQGAIAPVRGVYIINQLEKKIMKDFKLEELLGNIVYITLSGEGYYSGNSEQHSAFIMKDVYDKWAEVKDEYTPYFHELDGKHSEVEGETTIALVETKEELLEFLVDNQSADDSWMVYESMFAEFDTKESQEVTFNLDSRLKTTTVVQHTFDKEVFVLNTL